MIRWCVALALACTACAGGPRAKGHQDAATGGVATAAASTMDTPAMEPVTAAPWPAFAPLEPFSEPLLPPFVEPEYRQWRVDPRTAGVDEGAATEVTRVTDGEHFGVPAATMMVHQYAKVSPWNADNSEAVVFMQSDSAATKAVILGGQELEFRRVVPDMYVGGRWSTADPSIYYQVGAGFTPGLDAFNVHTLTHTTVADLSAEGYLEQARTGLFGGEGNQSVGDRFWALQLRHEIRGWEIVIWDAERDRITGAIPLPEQAGPGKNVDYWAISPRGQFVATYSDDDWISDGVPIPKGINVWSMAGEYLRTAPSSAGGHVDYCLDGEDEEVLAFIGTKYGANDKTGQMWRLDGSEGQQTVDIFPDGIVGWNFHISCASTRRPGVAVVSTFPSPRPWDYDEFPMWNHAFAVRLDGSGEIAVLANVHHSGGSETDRLYRRSSFAVANRDLSAIWFTACWDQAAGPIHSYVARQVLAAQVGASTTLPWRSTDIGQVGTPGTLTVAVDTLAITAGGKDMWAGGQSGHFAYVPVEGDVDVRVRVEGLNSPGNNGRAKAGIVIRESLAHDAATAFCVVVADGQTLMRAETGRTGETRSMALPGQMRPRWLRMVRRGNTFEGLRSVDGVLWERVGLAELALDRRTYAGLMVSGNYKEEPATVTAHFTGVELEAELLPEGSPMATAPLARKLERAAGGPSPALEAVNQLVAQRQAERSALLQAATGGRKLLLAGWSKPGPPGLQAKLEALMDTPFDGMVIAPDGPVFHHVRQPFHTVPSDEEMLVVGYYDELARAEFGPFTDNLMWIGATSYLDWFDDDQWEAVLHNTRLVLKGALLARCTGILFDPETYTGGHPWTYWDASRASEYSFQEYEAKVMDRGQEWMALVQEVMPDLPVLCLFTPMGYARHIIGQDLPWQEMRRLMGTHYYALYPAFFEGMLRAARGNTTLIDGNESAYYYQSSQSHLDFVTASRERGALMFPPELREQFARHVRVGSTYYPDKYYGLVFPTELVTGLTEAEQARWLQHNVYWALTTTDEYVWEWSEGPDWQSGDLFPGMAGAVAAGRELAQAGEPLGYDMGEVFGAATRRSLESNGRQSDRVAMAPRVTSGPVIDGQLDESLWVDAAAMTLDQQLTGEVIGGTVVRVAYDSENLYVGVQCPEPRLDLVADVVQTADGPVYEENSLEIFIDLSFERDLYYQLVVNSLGTLYDMETDGVRHVAWDSQSRLATARQDSAWTVEMAIPLARLSLEPLIDSGDHLGVNVCRSRVLRGLQASVERGCWSATGSSYHNRGRYGMLVLD